jgi:hypothetical protein
MVAIGETSSKGTVCVRTDLSKTFVLSTDYGGLVGDWIEMLTPGSPVQSVNGKTGTLNINTGDLSEVGNLFYTNTRARASISVNTPIAYNAGTGVLSADTSNSNSSLVSRWSLNQINTTNTTNLALKVNISDTSNMLYPYVRNNNLTSQLNNKLNLSDTAYMLNNRIGKDTLALSNRINLKIGSADTSAMLSNRFARDTLLLSSRISTKLNFADTTAMLNARFTRDTAALSNRINYKLNISDTATMLSRRITKDTAAISNRINLKLNIKLLKLKKQYSV